MVYFVQLRHGGPIKIGYTADDHLAQRIYALQSACPFELVVTRTITDATRADEALLHRRYRQARIRGEWFYPVDALAAEAHALPEVALLDLARQAAPILTDIALTP